MQLLVLHLVGWSGTFIEVKDLTKEFVLIRDKHLKYSDKSIFLILLLLIVSSPIIALMIALMIAYYLF